MDCSAPAEDVSRSSSSRSPLLRGLKKNNSAPTPRSATRPWVVPAGCRRAFSKRRRCCTPAATAPAACQGHDLGRRPPAAASSSRAATSARSMSSELAARPRFNPDTTLCNAPDRPKCLCLVCFDLIFSRFLQFFVLRA